MANNREHDFICLFLRKKYRSIMEIIALILEAARHDGATLYTIMKHTGINYAQLKKYLPSLIKIGFMEMEIKEDRISFRVSENGLAFLRQYNILRDMLVSAYTGNKQISTALPNGNSVLQYLLQHDLQNARNLQTNTLKQDLDKKIFYTTAKGS